MDSVKRLLIINRGEIAKRIDRAAQALGLEVHFVYEAGDDHHLRQGATAHRVNDYRDQAKLLEIAMQYRIHYIHPGYGYLAENGDFVTRVEAQGLVWVGPSAQAIELLGDKFKTKMLAKKQGVPVLMTASSIEETKDWQGPIMVKASMGGGGRAMQVAQSHTDCIALAERVAKEAKAVFQDGSLFFEPYLSLVRHIEVQVLADDTGRMCIIGDRDCSIQRRYQKIIEEAPARGLSTAERKAMHLDAKTLAMAAGITSCATVEFLFDCKTRKHWLMEVNPRIQVEHGVSEAITGIDLVQWQLKIAMGAQLDFNESDIQVCGHAIQARIYAEDPANDFMPSQGTMLVSNIPDHPQVNWQISMQAGDTLSPQYDPMIMKVIAHGDDFSEAKSNMLSSLRAWHTGGLTTNRAWLDQALTALSAEVIPDTKWVDTFPYQTVNDPDRFCHLGCVALFLSYAKQALNVGLPPSWRITGQPIQSTWFKVEDSCFKVDYQWLSAKKIRLSSGECISFHQITPSKVALKTDQHDCVYQTSSIMSGKWVITDHQSSFNVEVMRHNRRHPSTEGRGHVMTSAMPGTLVACPVTPGTIVAPGDVLAVVEAMKMHHEIKAVGAAKILSVNFKVGDHIAADTNLFNWECLTHA